MQSTYWVRLVLVYVDLESELHSNHHTESASPWKLDLLWTPQTLYINSLSLACCGLGVPKVSPSSSDL